jgi:endonuclease-3
MLVGFGQLICTKKTPRCDMCTLSAKELCPSARKVNTVNTKRKTRAVKVDAQGQAKVEVKVEETVVEKSWEGQDVSEP